MVESDRIIIIFHASLFAMISGGFVSFCAGLTTEHDGIDVFIARSAVGYIRNSPDTFSRLMQLVSDDSCYIGDTMFDVLDVLIDGHDQGVKV